MRLLDCINCNYYKNNICNNKKSINYNKRRAINDSCSFNSNAICASSDIPVTKYLNVDKINNLEDVKKLLEFLDISVTVVNGLEPYGFYKVKYLFE